MEKLDQSSLHPLPEHLETNMCLGRESNPGRLYCRRALKQIAIWTDCIFSVRNHYLCGDFTPLLSWGFSPRHMASPVYVFIEDIYSQRLDSLFTDNPGTHKVISSNHSGVTTNETNGWEQYLYCRAFRTRLLLWWIFATIWCTLYICIFKQYWTLLLDAALHKWESKGTLTFS